MRTLSDPPREVVDRATLLPRYGSYRGQIPRIELGALARDRFERLATEKRWIYVALTSDEWFVGAAIVDLGYAANAFAFACSRTTGMAVDRSLIGVPGLSRVRQTAVHRLRASFRHPSGRARIEQRDGDPTIELAFELPELGIHARLDTRSAPAAITAVAPIERGIVNTTEKRALLPVSGAMLVRGKRVELEGALGGYDFTHGLLARRTRWNWAYLQGRATSGEKVGLNLVQGFVGEPECALWVDGELFPLAEGRFAYDAARPLAPWKVTTEDGAVDLEMDPLGMHAERTDLRIVRSRFVQPVGVYRGTIRVPATAGHEARTLTLEHALGVTEDQDVVW